jgi:hypothetical protein
LQPGGTLLHGVACGLIVGGAARGRLVLAGAAAVEADVLGAGDWTMGADGGAWGSNEGA